MTYFLQQNMRQSFEFNKKKRNIMIEQYQKPFKNHSQVYLIYFFFYFIMFKRLDLERKKGLLHHLQNKSQSFQGSKNEHHQKQVVKKVKEKLTKELENLLRYLPDVEDIEFDCKNNKFNDNLIDELKKIEKEAIQFDLAQIKKLCAFAIGKRILNLEVNKKKQEYNQKIQKKQQIQECFRENRLKKLDFPYLVQQKMEQNSFIAQSYANGKGFIQSKHFYSNYNKALQQCCFLQTIKTVNKMFYQNFTGVPECTTFSNYIYYSSLLFFFLFVLLALTKPHISFIYQEYIIVGLLAFLLTVLTYISISAFIQKPNENNQIEQSIEDTKELFEKINKKNRQQGKNFEWIIPQGFMYLEVKFTKGIPI